MRGKGNYGIKLINIILFLDVRQIISLTDDNSG